MTKLILLSLLHGVIQTFLVAGGAKERTWCCCISILGCRIQPCFVFSQSHLSVSSTLLCKYELNQRKETGYHNNLPCNVCFVGLFPHRYLVSGHSYCRLGHTTVINCVHMVCAGIEKEMMEKSLPRPTPHKNVISQTSQTVWTENM